MTASSFEHLEFPKHLKDTADPKTRSASSLSNASILCALRAETVAILGWERKKETFSKAQRTRGLSSAYQSNLFRPYHKFKHKTWIKFHNINHASTSKSRPNISISTKLKVQNLVQTLASESRPRFKFMTSTKHRQQNTAQTLASDLAWTSTSKSWPNLVLKVWTKV